MSEWGDGKLSSVRSRPGGNAAYWFTAWVPELQRLGLNPGSATTSGSLGKLCTLLCLVPATVKGNANSSIYSIHRFRAVTK